MNQIDKGFESPPIDDDDGPESHKDDMDALLDKQLLDSNDEENAVSPQQKPMALKPSPREKLTQVKAQVDLNLNSVPKRFDSFQSSPVGQNRLFSPLTRAEDKKQPVYITNNARN